MRPLTTNDILPFAILGTVVAFVLYNVVGLIRNPGKRKSGAADPRPAPASPTTLGRARLDRSAKLRAIAFRRPFPPGAADRASTLFFGGVPLVPPQFRWPRRSDGRALTFVAQIDCARLPAASEVPDRALLPRDGALLFFIDSNAEPAGSGTQFVHFVPAGDWRPLLPPEDLVPFAGVVNAPYVEPWTNGSESEGHRYARGSRRFAMEPVPVDTAPLAPPDGMDWDEWYEQSQEESARALEAAFGPPLVARGLSAPPAASRPWRPFAAFPHSRRALRMIAGGLARECEKALAHTPENRSGVERARDQAVAWRDAHAEEDLESALEPAERDEFWSWLEALSAEDLMLAYHASMRGEVAGMVKNVAIESVEHSLAQGGTSADPVPAEVIDALAYRHAKRWRMADETPTHSYDHQLLGQPAILQDPAEAETHRLLLQLSYDQGLGWRFGDVGMYQYWLTPHDLAAGRWDRAVLTFDSH